MVHGNWRDLDATSSLARRDLSPAVSAIPRPCPGGWDQSACGRWLTGSYSLSMVAPMRRPAPVISAPPRPYDGIDGRGRPDHRPPALNVRLQRVAAHRQPAGGGGEPGARGRPRLTDPYDGPHRRRRGATVPGRAERPAVRPSSLARPAYVGLDGSAPSSAAPSPGRESHARMLSGPVPSPPQLRLPSRAHRDRSTCPSPGDGLTRLLKPRLLTAAGAVFPEYIHRAGAARAPGSLASNWAYASSEFPTSPAPDRRVVGPPAGR